MRIVTWNVNSLKARMPRVEAWLEETAPDVVLLQETKLADGAFPALAFEALGYTTAHHGQGQWNGVAILSRVGIDNVVANFDDGEPADAEARIISGTCAGLRVTSVYVPNGRSVGHDHYYYKLGWLGRLRAHLDRSTTPDQPALVGGDFNIAPEDRDVWSIAAFADSTHVTQPERDALDHVCDFGLVDLMRQQYPDPPIYSYWDYRAGDFHQGRGMRIDLLLGTAPVSAALRWGLVDRNSRRGTQPSDHAPVLVDLEPSW